MNGWVMQISQETLNIGVGIICSGLGWLLKTVWGSVKELQSTDRALAEEVIQIKLLVTGQYIKRDEMQVLHDALFRKLDKIEDRLNRAMIRCENSFHEHD